MIDAPPRPARKLPVDIVVKRAFLYAWESREVLLPPYLIYAALTILADLIIVHFVGPKNPQPEQIVTFLEELFALAFAVGVHRFVLLGEARPGFAFFRWDRHFVRYVLITVLLLILMLAAALPTASAALMGGPPNGAIVLLGTVTLFVAMMVLTRLSLLLPSAAVGDETRARQIWEATQGNSLRMLAATLLTSLPFLIAEVATLNLLPDDETSLKAALVKIVLGLLAPVQTIVLSVMLALSYDLLVRGNGPVIIDRPRR
ncbi:MAG TPA: hypothetical protein VL899_09485 [Alphaproteobacteria bacterium]|jgi:hypothetical protein|nr:hypothetical protein [Alphaproteobacteria bacterium]